MNEKEPGSYFTVMTITGNVKGKLVNTHRQPRIKTHLMKSEQHHFNDVYTLWCSPHMEVDFQRCCV